VVDSAGILLGIVTIDDLMDVAEEEVTEDFHKLGAVGMEAGGEGPIESIREAAVSILFRKRVVWLVLLVFVNILSAFGMSFFTETIAAAVALVFFLPLLIGSGGNAGSQSATLLVRGLATGSVKKGDLKRLLGKELLVSLLLGLTMAAAVAVIAVIRAAWWDIEAWRIGTIVASSMLLIVMSSCLVGMLLPFILQRFGRDPATASSPLVASIVDVGGVLIYFSLASALIL
jgi:magnesium transporter